jgi:hypothetical protein
MADLYHYWSDDLQQGSSGDLRPVAGLEESEQRVIRRLMTSPGELVFHPTYGAGLPAHVGDTMNLFEIESLIISQIGLESSVADTPQPTVTLVAGLNTLSVQIKYTESSTTTARLLSFTLDK